MVKDIIKITLEFNKAEIKKRMREAGLDLKNFNWVVSALQNRLQKGAFCGALLNEVIRSMEELQ